MMPKGQPPKTDEEFISVLADLFDSIEPESPEEIDAVLLEAGYDPDEVLARMLDAAQQAIAESPLNWRNAGDRLERERGTLASSAAASPATQEALIAAIKQILQGLVSIPPAVAGTFYRNLDEVSDDDLASTLADLRYLEAQQRNGQDGIEGQQ